jgi:adenylate cyclase
MHDNATDSLTKALAAAEVSGQRFALIMRSVAVLGVSVWLVAFIPSPRLYYYLSVVGLFLVLGLIPYLSRRHPRARAIMMAFIALDVAVIVIVTVLPPPFDNPFQDWPIQTGYRFPDYLYVMLYLTGSALAFSPLVVLWTGACVITGWSAAFLAILSRPETVGFESYAARDLPPDTPASALTLLLDPYFLSQATLLNQVVITSLATGLLAAAVWRARRTLVRQARAEAQRASFARYVSPDVAERMAVTPEDAFGAPTQRRVAILFADMVDFTRLAEQLSPDDVVALLHDFRGRASEVVFSHEGTLDKYLGDGLMATFGTFADTETCAPRALACALDLQQRVEGWNAERRAAGQPEVGVNIGVHCGTVVVGNVGTDRRLEFTVVGDAVNVASRLEHLTRAYGVRILASRAVVDAAGGPDALPAAFEARDDVTLRGRSAPIAVYAWPPRVMGAAALRA